jgi:hypothetical protein
MNNKSFERTDISETVLNEMRRQFNRFAKAVRYNDAPYWELSWEAFVELWRPHWRDRRRLNLVICRDDHMKPYALGNAYIDTRSNQVKQQWKNYRDRINRRDRESEA